MRPLAAAIRAQVTLKRNRERTFGRQPEAQWNILMDLALAHIEGRQVQVKGAICASGVPGTTALRHVLLLLESGDIRREADPTDHRTVLLFITEAGLERVIDAFALPAIGLRKVA